MEIPSLFSDVKFEETGKEEFSGQLMKVNVHGSSVECECLLSIYFLI